MQIYYKNNYPNSNGNKTKITENLIVKAVSSPYFDLYSEGLHQNTGWDTDNTLGFQGIPQSLHVKARSQLLPSTLFPIHYHPLTSYYAV